MYLGFDTSNYTTSACLITDSGEIYQQKKLLTVKQGQRGLRQSEALFQHTVNMPEIVKGLVGIADFQPSIKAVAVSSRPRNVENSYMPCFLSGINTANAVSAFTGAKYYETSHQIGHILAVLFAQNRLDLIKEPFIALHLSGGTTEALLVTPDKDEIIKAQIIAESLDLKAGQAIDRAGVLLGLTFPCGKELDKLAQQCTTDYKHRVSMKGNNISLSGVENKVKAMVQSNAPKQEVAGFVITYIAQSVTAMLEGVCSEYGKMPIVFSGGVSSNSTLRNTINAKFSNVCFALPEYSCDNAVGIAAYAYLKDKFNE